MSFDEATDYSLRVDDWIKQQTCKLASEELLLLFDTAIRAIRKRTAMTLSEVTITPILDRVLYMSQKKFPIFSEVEMEIEPKGISLNKLLENSTHLKRDEIITAFRFFLIELITLLGNLTADILTQSLFRVLSQVTAENTHKGLQSKHRTLRSIKGSSDRGDV